MTQQQTDWLSWNSVLNIHACSPHLFYPTFNLLTHSLTHPPTHSLTHSMKHSLSLVANRFSASQEIPSIYGNRSFIAPLQVPTNLSLSSAGSIQSIPPHPTSWWSFLMLSSHLHLGLTSGFFPQVSPSKSCMRLSSPHTRYMHRPSHCYQFDHSNNIGWAVQIIKQYRSLNSTDH